MSSPGLPGNMGQKCQACNWCFPFCCCVGPQLHMPLAVAAIFLFIMGIVSIDNITADGTDTSVFYYIGGFGDFLVWTMAILNLTAPIAFLVSLFSAVDMHVRRLCVFIYFIYLCIEALLAGLIFCVFFYISAVWDSIDCNDSQDVCDAVATFFWVLTVFLGLIMLMLINWAMATWYHYANNLGGGKPEGAGGAGTGDSTSGGATDGGAPGATTGV